MMVKRRVVFYARVSTEHELQISALDNQITWYYDEIAKHEDWEFAGKYIDEGITGTSADKRPQFLKMLDDGLNGHEFDLIVTREVCRFARNTVDTLTCTRDLKKGGIEVYFVLDNIMTFNNDGELRLTLMATLAQEESRKISERVRAGLDTARKNGVILGSGNILGYSRNKLTKEFEIDPEEAETVRMIFSHCLNGKGCKKIKFILEKEGRLNSIGESRWQLSTISRILSNPFYAGLQNQQQSVSDGYLTQNRVKNEKSEYILIEGKHQPIISREIFDTVQKLKAERLTHDNSGRITGKNMGEDVWMHKLICNCGSRYRKYKWRAETFGYTCYNQVINGKASNREKNGLDTKGACDLPCICDWKLDMMAWIAVKRTWTNGTADIEKAFEIVKECYTEQRDDTEQKEKGLEKQKKKLERRKNNLMEMRADGEISKEEFKEKKEACESALLKLEKGLSELAVQKNRVTHLEEEYQQIKTALERMIDFSSGVVDHDVLEEVVERIVHTGNYDFAFYLNLDVDNISALNSEEKEVRVKQFGNTKGYEIIKENRIKLFDLKINFETAKNYRKMMGKYLRENQWTNINVEVYI